MERGVEKRAEQRIAGLTKPLEALRELIIWPSVYFREAELLGLKWPRGLLLHGPPGTGKTSLVHAMVHESGAHLITLSSGTVHKAFAGESERLIREAFAEGSSRASSGKPAIIFIDEIDALCPRRNARHQHEARLVAQLLTLMDDKKQCKGLTHVVVIAATNRVNAIDPALRRPGRFDREIEIMPPNAMERYAILQLHAKNLLLDANMSLKKVADMCNGYVGADLAALCREAAMSALRRSMHLENVNGEINLDDWKHAHAKVGPSIVRGLVVEIPAVTWEDIGGLHEVKKKLRQAVEWPIQHVDAFARLGLKPPRGILLHGPPGCSKTTLVKAVAHSAKANLFSLSGAELYSMFVGEGEAHLRETFARARLAAPSIIFFDEADAISARRDGGDDSKESSVGERLLSTLLTEIDGLELTQGILVLGATNRPWSIDGALMRPGRFDQVLYVPPPDKDGRLEILKVHSRSMRLGDDVDLLTTAADTEFFTGAELEALCREAGMAALREDLSAEMVRGHHFAVAMESIRPLLTKELVCHYSSFVLT